MEKPQDTKPELTVQITALASGGSCVGTITTPEAQAGKKMFVPFTIPGEEVVAITQQDKKSFSIGELLRVIQPAPERTDPRCGVFGQCGGCDLQHIELSAQRRFKVQMVRDLLHFHGGVSPREDISVLGEDLPGFEYRRRMSFHINKKREFGLYRKNGRQIVEITKCPISTPTINEFLRDNLELIRGCAPEVETVTLEDHDGEIFVAFEVHPRNSSALPTLLPKPEFRALEAKTPNIQVNYRHKAIYTTTPRAADAPPVGHFSQNNRLANIRMLERICELVATEKVTDLYAGAGNISIPLAQAGHTVTAVEVDPHLVKFGIERAKASQVAERLTFHTASCEKWVEKNTPDTTIVLDPPRGGAIEVCKRLSTETTSTIVYVSCYPPTFARDVQELEQRGYRLKSVEILDMFPQTYHCELVAVIERG